MADKSAYIASQLGQIVTAVLKKMATEKSKVSSSSISNYLSESNEFRNLVHTVMTGGDKSDVLKYVTPLRGFVSDQGLKTVEDMVFDPKRTHDETMDALLRTVSDHLLSLEKRQHKFSAFIDDVFSKFVNLQADLTSSLGHNIEFVEKDLAMDKKLLNEAQDMHRILKSEDSIEYLKSKMLDSFSSFVNTFDQKTTTKRDHLGTIATEYSNVNNELEQYKNQVNQLQSDLNRYKNESIQDHMTGLYNRKYMDMKLTEEIERFKRMGTPFSIVMADIDKFKSINDTYGHQVGDQVLKHMSQLIKENIRRTDFAFRYGGEEFMILLVNADARNATHVSEMIRKKLEATNFSLKDCSFNVTASFGIAQFKPDDTAESAIKLADERLYTAKQSGRNRIVSN
ncbi:GGDEF domain-containing protein [Seleniivibrio sp.]|uniref:GGDEF domain-containing protein n=1 Tax=Seleniivibrio sp. TaxID=2898801 RepID=UPI0025CF36F6|nr:GGDEF domain-containing protein [Seleniivibrio sp.]MCD8552771.1 GGDEF domain-containing protein [Seleniivibrio sp.]